MDCAVVNILKLHSKYQEFRNAVKYTDVTLECEGETFKCHRLILASASHYFDTMLSGDFKEREESAIVRLEIDTKTLKDVLEFIYTGTVVVNSDNFYNLLRAGDYFELAGVEDLCVRFIQKNRIVGEKIFDIFTFASTTDKKMLQRFLIDDLKAQLKIVSRSTQFLEMPFIDLCALFDQLLPINEDVLYAVFIQWIEYSREQRWQYFDRIFEKYQFKNLSNDYLRFVASKVYNVAGLLRNLDESLELPSSSVSRDKALYIYVKNNEKNSVSIFSVNGSLVCSNFDTMKLNGTNDRQWIRSVVVDNFYVYSLQYVRRGSEIGNQLFTLHTLDDVHSAKSLKSPPLIFRDMSMCSLRNCIYIHNHTLDQPITRTGTFTSADKFNDEEIRRGIYMYHCELSKWFPVPAMKNAVEDASVVSCGDILYLVGGRNPNSSERYIKFQTYDPRTRLWQIMSTSKFHHTTADCCVLGDKIYACGGSNEGNGVEMYNPAAGCWKSLSKMRRPYHHHKVVSFLDEIWAMGNFINGDPDNETFIEIYNPTENSWRTSPILTNAIKQSSTIGTCTVLDCFVV